MLPELNATYVQVIIKLDNPKMMKLKAEGEHKPGTASSSRAYSGSKEDGNNTQE